MTQAYNLSQLANNLNSSGQLDATDGLVNAVPIANGGTAASTASAARTNLDVPSRSGSGASGNWGIGAQSLATTNFTMEESGGSLIIRYGATVILSISSAGVVTAKGSVIGNGTP